MFNAKYMNVELLRNEDKLVKFKNAIIKEFPYTEDDFESWLDENDLRVYDNLDYNVVLDSWFYTQHLFENNFEVKDDKFIINPSEENMWYYENHKLKYDNTIEGLREAFFNGHQGFYSTVNVDNKEYFICVDEI